MAKTKKQTKAKEPIKIRFKCVANGNKSIYLDLYNEGKREYEFLKLYLIPEVDDASRAMNANTMQTANAIKAQRIIELANGKAGLQKASTRSNMLLMDWLGQYKKEQARKGLKKINKTDTLASILVSYKGRAIRLADVDKKYCKGFIDYLTHTYVSAHKKAILNKSTARLYCGQLNAILNSAVRAELMLENPFSKIDASDKVQVSASQRAYLTIDEVKTLVATPCKYDAIKSAFLFSCCCGLRASDVMALTWGKIVQDGEQSRIELVMQKTKEPLYLPLSQEALKWLPKRGNANDADKVFTLPTHNYINAVVKAWAKEAGITKNVTFHTSRHTFATTLLTLGADLYTTSKLLGHANVNTTQIYAKIVNQKKVEAVTLFNNVFED